MTALLVAAAMLAPSPFVALDDEAFERLEETLIYADVGAPTTAKIVERLETEAQSGDLQGGEDLSRRLQELLAETARVDGDTIPLTEHPTVILVTGVALTKLDGSAKGGIAVAIAHELGVPVKLIGIGEALEDLRPFDPDDFAKAILEP